MEWPLARRQPINIDESWDWTTTLLTELQPRYNFSAQRENELEVDLAPWFGYRTTSHNALGHRL